MFKRNYKKNYSSPFYKNRKRYFNFIIYDSEIKDAVYIMNGLTEEQADEVLIDYVLKYGNKDFSRFYLKRM